MTNLTVISPPAGEAVSLSQAKAFLRIGHDGEDALVSDLIGQATARVEQAGGLALITRTLRAVWSRWPPDLNGRGARLPIGPVRALQAVNLIDENGAVSDETARFRLDCGRLSLRPWSMVPGISPGGRVDIVFEAGFGLASGVPDDLIEAVLLTLQETYERRDTALRRARDEGPLPERAEAILKSRRGVRL